MTARKVRVGKLPALDLSARLEAGIVAAFDTRTPHLESVRFKLDEAINEWRYKVDGLFDRWPCEDRDCPARPAWDVALDDALAGGDKLLAHVEGEIRDWLFSRLLAFAKAHPEAVLAPLEAPAG